MKYRVHKTNNTKTKNTTQYMLGSTIRKQSHIM